MKKQVIAFICTCIIISLSFTFWFASSQSQQSNIPAQIQLTATPLPDLDALWATWEALPASIKHKVDPRLLDELRGEILPAHLGGTYTQTEYAPGLNPPPDKTRFLVYLTTQTDLKLITQQRFPNAVEQREVVFNALQATAQQSQAPTKQLLETHQAQNNVAAYQSFYIFNGFAVEGNLVSLIDLAQRDDVARIVANYPLVPLFESFELDTTTSPRNDLTDLELDPHLKRDLGGLNLENWNIDLVDAERVWYELGITGEGIVVGGFDTGVDINHPALRKKYRGYSETVTFNNYNWFEPDGNLYEDGNLGPSVSLQPYDCYGHGTHTMGTMVGDGETSTTKIGMAPGAKWIALPGICSNTMPGSLQDDIGGLKAFQWLLCPTDLTGDLSTADCSKAPDVINNSWGSANPADQTFRPILQTLRAAGIVPVFGSGNPLAGLGSIGSPSSIPEVIAVGATDINDYVASFSGRGPSFYEGEQKPEFTAPGVSVNSSANSGYFFASGTSMAAPHVAGLIALMKAADLQDGFRDFNSDELETVLINTAIDFGPPGPDNDYGYGRIDAYKAVQWVLSAGDLQGYVYQSGTTLGVPQATITGINVTTGDIFTTKVNGSGAYAITVPAGTYNLTASAWGYNQATFNQQVVLTSTLSIADFSLTPLPKVSLNGQVTSGGQPVANALLYVSANPSTKAWSNTAGNYNLSLPAGEHEIVIEADYHRRLTQTVTIDNSNLNRTFQLTAAPSILFVNADGFGGWFFGWPLQSYYQWALDKEGYLYDTWSIEYFDFDDTQVLPDNTLGYGIPSTKTLSTYDVVIWAHSGWSPGYLGAADHLITYLEEGGRLILSGQEIGFDESRIGYPSATLFNDYLHADVVRHIAASEGETASGASFLEGYTLKLTNATLYGYPNGAVSFQPDGVAPEPGDGSAYPILNYDTGYGAAALAVDSCSSPYRAIYFAAGYENFAPRGNTRDPAIAEVLDKSITWVTGNKPEYDLNLMVDESYQTEDSGEVVTYTLNIINSGATTGTYQVTFANQLWATELMSGTTPITQPIELGPCTSRTVNVVVSIPDSAQIGDRDTLQVTVWLTTNPAIKKIITLTTITLSNWQREADILTPRYRMGVAAIPDDSYYYVIGGWASGGTTRANQRYNACNDQWESMASLPKSIANLGAAALDGKIYAAGGSDNLINPQSNLYVYHPISDTWTLAANMPLPLSGPAVAAAEGKLYVFGGLQGNIYRDTTFAYDPTTNTWSEKSPMAGGSRIYAGATTLDNKIYIIGGWPNLKTVEMYDPATDTWSTLPSLIKGRQSPGVTSGPDGYIYVSGGGQGWIGLSNAERYNPATNIWGTIPPLNNSNRPGAGSAYANGRIFTVGGVSFDPIKAHESFLISDDFCLSTKYTLKNTTEPGGYITYTVELHPDFTPLKVGLIDPIPDKTTFHQFGVNPIGATYDSTNEQIVWHGDINPTQLITFTFSVVVSPTQWQLGDKITNTIIFTEEARNAFSKTTVTLLNFPDFADSEKTANEKYILEEDILTYTIRIENNSLISDSVTLSDKLPPEATYIPNSLTYTLGNGSYITATNTIIWAGRFPSEDSAFRNEGTTYMWGDSTGNGSIHNVKYDWIDISTTGTPLNLPAEGGKIIPIGFNFTFFDNTYPAKVPVLGELGVSENGYLTFQSNYSSLPDLYDYTSDCPINTTWDPNDIIAPYWSNLSAFTGNVYYQTLGVAPNRYLVIQWDNVNIVSSGQAVTFQVILYEQSSVIKFQYQTLTTNNSYTVGLESKGGTQGVTYNTCRETGQVYNQLAVLFLPPGGKLGEYQANVDFAVKVKPSQPINTWLTNTAKIVGSYGTVTPTNSTLINPILLDKSTLTLNKDQLSIGEEIEYVVAIKNTGLLSTTQANLKNTLPTELTYVSDSLQCIKGTCNHSNGAISWGGSISPGEVITVSFAASLNTPLPNATPVTNTVRLNNGYGDIITLRKHFLARNSDLSQSFKQISNQAVRVGEVVTYTISVYNNATARSKAQLRDVLPPTLQYQPASITCGNGDCTYQNGAIVWTGFVPPRSIVAIRFRAKVTRQASMGDIITNTAIVTDTIWDIGYPVTATANVVRSTDLWLQKEGPGVTDPGEIISYTIRYGNQGPNTVINPFEIGDILPPGSIYLAAQPSGVYSAANHTLLWNFSDLGLISGTLGSGTFGSLNPGIAETIVVTLSIPSNFNPVPAILTNTAWVSQISSDPIVSNNKSIHWLIVGSDVNLLNSTKTVTPATGTQGDVISYIIHLENSGIIASTATITDKIPAGMRYIASSSQVNQAPTELHQGNLNQINWQGAVPSGEMVTITYQAEITTPLGTKLVNTVEINDNIWLIIQRRAAIQTVAAPFTWYPVYLPLVFK